MGKGETNKPQDNAVVVSCQVRDEGRSDHEHSCDLEPLVRIETEIFPDVCVLNFVIRVES